MSKDFLPLHFAGRCSQFHGMIWKTEEYRVSKNIALYGGENPDFDFVPLLFILLT